MASDSTTAGDSPRLVYYDIAFAKPREQNTAAPNPWKARYALNFKGIPYSTEWVEMPDITKTRKSLGASACRKFADGTDFYTLPVLKDSNTGAIIGDSFDIALYLQETFPDSGGDLFPEQPDLNFVCPGAMEILIPLSKREDVAHTDYSRFNTNVDWAFTLHVQLMAPGMRFDPDVEGQVKAEFAKRAGTKTWEEMWVADGEAREKMLVSLRETLTDLARLFQRDGSGPYLLGGQASHADFIVGGWLRMMERTMPAGEWKQVEGWHDGAFGRLHAALQERFGDVK
ncbi:hypothetical protein QBC40DRAFT_108419 [Triangularia verruculosa]|uniref:GST N-terminal domain-containing protein n=1 Tax=Triangularia verruculosa TaxID=2587418 RepID=A0AAN6XAP8_9PEZI|nr:hypothetical protein QBC40DRAFT_108419 [Triangularia verruculosa]